MQIQHQQVWAGLRLHESKGKRGQEGPLENLQPTN